MTDPTAGPTTEPTDERRAEVAAALAAIRQRIDRACHDSGRDPAEVRLLPITKTFPASDVAILMDLGLSEFGENRDQDAGRKAAQVAELRPGLKPRWHMVGQLQRNKARSVLGWADVVQTVDSPRLAEALAKAAAAAMAAGTRSEPLDVLIQVSLDGDPQRGGAVLPDLPGLADVVTHSGELILRGVMAVAPLGSNPQQAFGELAEAARRLRVDHQQVVEISAGMSGDLEAAVAQGSTLVRVGTSLLGGRRIASP